MVGTNVAETAAIRLTPPIMTKPMSPANTAPDIQDATPKEVSIPDAMLLAWGMLPEPNELTTVAMAKKTASHFMPRPYSM